MHDTLKRLTTPDALHRLATARDTEAWAFLLEEHGPWLLALARRFTRDDSFAEDIVQEVLLHIRDHAAGYQGNTESSARAWLARVTCNLAIGLLRSGRRQRRRDTVPPERTPAMDSHAQLELAETLQHEVVRLPESLRRPLVLRYFAELSLSEIAATLNLSETAVKTRVCRGVERLRKQLVFAGIPVSAAMLERALSATPAASGMSTTAGAATTHAAQWQSLLHSSLSALPEPVAATSAAVKPLLAALAGITLLAGIFLAKFPVAPPASAGATAIAQADVPPHQPAPVPTPAPAPKADDSEKIKRLIDSLNDADVHVRDDSEAALCALGTAALQALHATPRSRPIARVIRKIEADQEFKLMAEQRAHRSEIALLNGGSRETEKAVDDALAWLATHQDADGHWPIDTKYTVGATSISLLALLGGGNTEDSGPYAENVRRGVKWLIAHQTDTGAFLSPQDGCFGYEQPMAATAIAEAAVLSHQPATVDAARKALNNAIANQSSEGSWSYQPLTHSTPDPHGDVSIAAWYAQFLHLARGSELNAGDDVLEQTQKFLATCQTPDGGFGYAGPQNASASCTAMGGFITRLLQGSKLDVDSTAKWLERHNAQPADDAYQGIYSAYYQSNCLFQSGGAPWAHWNTELKSYLLQRQSGSGPDHGTWTMKNFAYLSTAGQTALGALCLETYYRYPRMSQK